MHVEKAAKVRKEIEWCLSPGDSEGEQLHDLLTSLGFTPVATVSKQRQSFHWPDHHPELSPVTFTLDDVDEVGLFAEIEWIVDEKRQAESSSEGVDLAIGQLQRIANQFELTELVRESYLELLLLRRGR
jgi:adenylate cyclase class 2